MSVDPLEIVFLVITRPGSSKGEAAISLGQSLVAIRGAEEKLGEIDLASSRAFLDAQDAFLVGEYSRVEELVARTVSLATLALTPTPTVTPTPTPSPLPAQTPTPSPTPTPTAAPRPAATATRSPTPSPTPTATAAPRPAATATHLPTRSPTPTSTHTPIAASRGAAVVTPVPNLPPTQTSTPSSGGGCTAPVGRGTSIDIGLLLLALVWPAREVTRLRIRLRRRG